MKTSDKFAIATWICAILVGIAIWLSYVYETRESLYLLMICLGIMFIVGLATYVAEENEPKPPSYS